MSTPVYALLYQSDARFAQTRGDLDRILSASVPRNASDGVTGLLMYGELTRLPDVPGQFVQWLEGPEDAVRAAYARIRIDNRHADVQVLAEGPAATLTGTDERLFPQWSMELMRLADLPGTLYGFLNASRMTA
ncbi:MAG TPA: BLUF domain-containing protein [Rubricoccaceae bacterium]